ncbi:CHASE2 domain-containing protein [Glaciimonas sp. PCH181]|uniref:CHASE2 domain-containing protein n=1 Tax=Glaciimonas sp. PCH181 TaxID=2133943 RepID=UPI000D3AAA62|nr:CHASE2 domain-containing protein [Glaciimonas sp. PCH181]PUA16361.1 histidine kinase [Glaciimonas sp. PCH181]
MAEQGKPFASIVHRVALRQWLALTLVLVVITAALGYQNGLPQLDRPLYDQFMRLNWRPANDDIIIVAIDDYSISQLGRWPWRRSLHAQLIDVITQAQPRAIGLDVIMPEPETASANNAQDNDDILAQALRASNLVVLPMVTAMNGNAVTSLLPIPAFQHSARTIGHINLELDADGVVRSVFLKEGQNGVWWPHFALAMAENAGQIGIAAQGAHLGEQQSTKATHWHSTDASDTFPNVRAATEIGQWQRDDQIHIPYAGSSGHFRSVPYVSVLRGEVPANFFKGKYVLIGATALGMADAFPTPVSGTSGVMPGIEINANILASLLDHESIRIATSAQTMLLSVVPVLLALLSYFLLTPRLALLLTAFLMVVTAAISYLLLGHGLWIAPSAALIGLTLAYPLWSWCRLEAAISYLGQEFMLLDQEPHLLPESTPRDGNYPQGQDVLEQRINAMRNAARRVRDLRQFISDNLDSLPDATLITDSGGHVLVVNQIAKDYFNASQIMDITGAFIPTLLATIGPPPSFDTAANHAFNWPDLLDRHHLSLLADGVPVQDQRGRDLLIKSAPCHSARQVLTGWIVSIIDITSIRAAERSRDETLRFLSHDMRAPQASILALLELQGTPTSALPQQEFFSRIERASRKTLGLADNFVQLARAESETYRLEEVDFQDVVFDASDEMWTLANNKQITLVTDIANGEFLTKIDRSLMARALCNLISNAINYSPAGTCITCTLGYRQKSDGDQTPATIVCEIRDQGYGISLQNQTKLFQRFQRVSAPDQPKTEGVGLGLVFVKTVVERHFGSLSFQSAIGEGTIFTITLPALTA